MPEYLDQEAPATHRFPPVLPGQIPTQRGPLPAPAPRRARRWPWIVAVILALFVGMGIGSAGKAAPAASPQAAAPAASLNVPAAAAPNAPAPSAPAPVAAAPAPAAPAPVQAAPAGPATTMGDGTYEVGVDIAVGRYKTPGPDASSITHMCGWSRNRNDSGEFDAIIANGIASGPSSVTVKKGEFFQLTGGCYWVKQ